MTSPLDPYASLSLKLFVPGTVAVSGRGINETDPGEIVACCWVRLGSDRLRSDEGSVFSEVPLSGYYLSPKLPSPLIRPGVSAAAVLWRLSSDFSLIDPATGLLRVWGSHARYDAFVSANQAHIDHEGTFTIGATIASPYQLPDTLLGKRLSGLFSYRTQWGDVI